MCAKTNVNEQTIVLHKVHVPVQYRGITIHTHLTKEDAASAKVWGLDLRQVTVQTSSTQNQAPDLKHTGATGNNKMMPVIVTEIT